MMDVIRILFKSPKVTGILGFIVGLFVGLVLLGWWMMPVQWTDAAPKELEASYRADYLRMAIQDYVVSGNQTQAKARWDGLGSKASTALTAVEKDKGGLSEADIAAYKNIVKPTSTTGESKKGPSILLLVVIVLCVITLIIGAILAYFFLFRGKGRGGIFTPAMQAQEAARQAPMTDYSAQGQEPPIAQFMASYKLGDDLFDDSFSIDSPSGEFLGECGVGISETIGVGDPKKVTAFEVWLFDKNDIQTITKVIMSTHAFNDEGSRQRMAAKGEPVQAQPGGEVYLETATLRLVGRVVDLTYGEGALPPESFFDQAILELAIWQK
jgi:hypothetical protein